MKKGILLALLVAFVPSALAQNNSGLNAAQAKRAEAYYHFSLARILDQQEEYDKSISEYKKALELSPSDSVIYSSMAQTYLNVRNREEAVKSAETAVKLNPTNIGAHRLLRDIHIRTIDDARNRPISQQALEAAVDNAIRELEQIVRLDPTDRNDFMLLAALYKMDNSPEKAAEILKKHIDIDPGSETGVLELAKLYIESDNTPDAIELLQNFVKDQPEADRAMELLGDAYTDVGDTERAAEAYKRAFSISGDEDVRGKYAEALYSDNQLEEAAKVYEEILKEDQRNDAVIVRLGQIYRQQTRYTEARAAFNRALTLRRNDLGVRFNLVLLDRDEGRFEEGIKGLTAILNETEKTRYTPEERRTRSLFLTHLGLLNSLLIRYDVAIEAFMKVRDLADAGEKSRVDNLVVDTFKAAKNLDKAMTHLEMALKESPNSRELQIAYADLLSQRGRHDEGIQTLQKLSRGGEPDFEIMSAMAGIYEGAKRFTEAQAILETAQKRFPDQKEVYFLQGALHERQKKYAEAEQSFRRALELDRNNPSVLNYLGYMLADRGLKLDEALVMIKKAVDSDPINGAFLDSLGWVYFKLERFDLAEQYLKRAVTFAANNATMHDHLGDLYYKLGKYQDAQASWTTGLKYADDPDEAAQIRQKLDLVKTRVANR
jgi:tetratricopeptide (TPR) repeat protein